MQFFHFASLLLLAGTAAAQTSGAASALTDGASASSLTTIPEAAVAYVLGQTGIDLSKRTVKPQLQMARKQRRQAGGDQINVSGDCSQGKAQCCDTVMSGSQADDLTSLLQLKNVASNIGINCVQLPINAVGVSGALANTCKSTPVCCQNVTQDGLINLGCNALPIN